LAQFISCTLFTTGIKRLLNQKASLIAIGLVSVAGLATHYSFYIFFACFIAANLVFSHRLKETLKFYMPWIIFGCAVALIYWNNSTFRQSLAGMKLTYQSPSPITKLVSLESVVRVKEVLTNYYFYGLYYYRLDLAAQVVVKKVILATFLAAVFSLIRLARDKVKTIGLITAFVLALVLISSLIGESFGLYPFGGRHIMPFSFLLYLILAIGLAELSKRRRWLKGLITVCLIMLIFSFVSFQSCSQVFWRRYPGNGDPQGDIYIYCAENLTPTHIF